MNTGTNTSLIGIWLITGRVAWFITVGLVLAFMLYNLADFPATLARIESSADASLTSFVTFVGLLRRYLLALFYFIFGAVLFLQKGNDRMALIASMAFFLVGAFPLVSGVHSFGIIEIPTLWQAVIFVLLTSTISVGFLVGLTYPNGRFDPPQARWLMVLAMVVALSYTTTFFAQQDAPIESAPPILALLAVTIGLQVRRYQRATDTQKQQIKLYVLANIGFLVLQVAGVLALFLDGGRNGVLVVVADVLLFCSFLSLLVLISLAVARYRLWDVDFVINRSLAYGALTVVLSGIFLTVFFVLQALLSMVFDMSEPMFPLAMAGMVVLALFQVTSTSVRQFIDRRVYGIDIDYDQIARRDARYEKTVATEDGQTFGDYGQLKVVGRGGMGVVYRAMHTKTKQTVAIKVLKDIQLVDGDDIKRFYREARTMQGLDHPNIARVHEIGELNSTPYFTMEYVEGKSLGQTLKERGALLFEEALPIFVDIAAALDYAHVQGIVHRDIKPANVMLDAVRTDRYAVLMDFGIAHVLGATRMTQTNSMLGTLDYISPEQIRGAYFIDYRSDLYSFGILAYHTLSGEMPFHRENAGATVLAHIMQPPPDIRRKSPHISLATSYAIMRAMDKNPDSRFNCAKAFVDAMRG